MIIAVDFDGTIVEHDFPRIGAPVPGAIKWLKTWQGAGAKLILWTMRSDGRDDGSSPLAEAVEYCRKNGVEFWAVNGNPEQHTWTGSPKAYAQIYVDDAGFGCPLIESNDGRPYVDWSKVGPKIMRLLKPKKAKRVS